MAPCDHLPGPNERDANGDCIHCVRAQARAQAEAASATEVKLSASAGAATLDIWLKHPGDPIAAGDVVARLTTSRGQQDAVAAIAGTLGIHRARPGAVLKPGTLLARIAPARAPAAPDPEPLIEDSPSDLAETPSNDADFVAEEARTDTAIVRSDDHAADVLESRSEEQAVATTATTPEAMAPSAKSGVDAMIPLEPQETDDAVIERSEFRYRDDGNTPGRKPQNTGSEDELIIQHLRELRDEGIFIVSLIGFFAGGKTWFLNRLKHVLKGHMLEPPAARDGTEVRRTNNVAIHTIRSVASSGTRPQEFAIVDLPGEMIGTLVNNPLEGSNAVLAALIASGALIVALPADEVMLAQDAAERKDVINTMLAAGLALENSEDPVVRAYAGDRIYADRIDRLALAHDQLQDFADELCFIAGLLSTVRYARIPFGMSLREAGIDRAAVARHLRSGEMLPFATPTYIALTKADRVRDPDTVTADLIGSSDGAVLKAMLADPRELVLVHREELVAKFDQWFGQYKFDFVSAFEGHGSDTRINYRRPFHGVWAVIEWIAWCRQTGGKITPAMVRARNIRKRRDGALTVTLQGLGDRVEPV